MQWPIFFSITHNFKAVIATVLKPGMVNLQSEFLEKVHKENQTSLDRSGIPVM